jgi:Tol biopolymer transport system component
VDADWSPDGSKLVVTHYAGGRCALEFPPGKVLYETTGGVWLSHPRVSPRGDQIAFLEHPLGGGADDAGFVEIMDLAGNKRALSRESESITGVAWDPAGNDDLFTPASLLNQPRKLGFSLMDGDGFHEIHVS